MKNTIWIFGDSYTQDLSEREVGERDHITQQDVIDNPCFAWIRESWTWQLASKLNMQCKHFGMSSTSIEYSAQKYIENFSKFEEGDVVIFAVTQIGRKYLIQSRPSWSTHWQINAKMKDHGYTQNDIDFYSRALVDLYNSNETLLSLLLHSSAALKNRNVKLVFVPCFYDAETRFQNHRDQFPGSINETIGNLFDNVTKLESVASIRETVNHSGADLRKNHMHKVNHEILVDKLIEYIVNNIPLDLINGFVKDIFDKIPEQSTNGFDYHPRTE